MQKMRISQSKFVINCACIAQCKTMTFCIGDQDKGLLLSNDYLMAKFATTLLTGVVVVELLPLMFTVINL